MRHFADVRKEVDRGVTAYVRAVKDGSFPNPEREGYAIDPIEWESFLHTQAKEASVAHAEQQRSLGGGSEGSDGADSAQLGELRTSALPRANETDEKTGKKAELHTL